MSDSVIKIFEGAPRIELIQILDRRETRSHAIANSLADNANSTVVSVCMNIPGPYKTSPMIQHLFMEEIKSYQTEVLDSFDLIRLDMMELLDTGPECLIVVNADPLEIKKLSVEFENSALRRLFDFDVHYFDSSSSSIVSLKRSDVGAGLRTCLICDQDAKVCASRRLHTVEEMQKKINDIVIDAKGW